MIVYVTTHHNFLGLLKCQYCSTGKDMQLHRIIQGALIIHPSWEMLDVSASNKTSFPSLDRRIEGLILGLRIANERRRYFVKHLSLAGRKPRISPDIVIVLLQRSQLPWLKCFCREIFSSIGNLTTNVCSTVVIQSIVQQGMLLWWSLLDLLSWCPIVKACDCKSIEDLAAVNLNWRWGIFKLVSKSWLQGKVLG